MKRKLPAAQASELIRIAREVALNSYARFSKFRVGAAVLTPEGIFRGTNVENSSFPLGLCAERAALSAAVAAGSKKILAVGISCIDAKGKSGEFSERMPCGACRQWFQELAPDAEIIIDGIDRTFTTDDLMAFPFNLRATPKKGSQR